MRELKWAFLVVVGGLFIGCGGDDNTTKIDGVDTDSVEIEDSVDIEDVVSGMDETPASPSEPAEENAVDSDAENILQLATYSVEFVATWSASSHPLDFPSNPHFSGLVGAVHNSDVSFWQSDATATPGIRSMAETGSKSALLSEVSDAMGLGFVASNISAGGIGTSPGRVTTTITVTQDHPLITMVSMIAPSPDWFVGVHAYPLFENGQWLEEVTIDLLPYDAGTDSGSNYVSANQATQPPEAITVLLDATFSDDGESPRSLGQFIFKRIVNE